MKIDNPTNFINGTHKSVPNESKIDYKPVLKIIAFLSCVTVFCIIGVIITGIMYEDKPWKPISGPNGAYVKVDGLNIINGDNTKVSLDTNEVKVLGHHNEIVITNNDITLIEIGGFDNTVYYPKNSNPSINISKGYLNNTAIAY